MSNRLIMKYKYFMLGAIFWLLILLLALLKIINMSKGIYLFFISIPLFVWIKLHSLTVFKNNIFSAISFHFLMIIYFGLLGNFFHILRLHLKICRYWIFFVLFVGLNIIFYHYSVIFFNSLEEGIRKVFELIK